MTDPHLMHAALDYLAHGWSLCPVHAGRDPSRDKNPHGRALALTGYLDPDTRKSAWRGLQDAPPSEATVRQWLSLGGVGVALVTGTCSGVVVLDFDGAQGEALLRELGLKPHVRTPSGGYHVRVQHPGWRVSTVASKSTRALPPGLDIRGDGGLSMLPPTWTCKGAYTALREPYQYADVSHLPAELLRVIGLLPPEPKAAPAPIGELPHGDDRFPADRILFRALEKLGAGDGRNDTGYWLARALHNNNYTLSEILTVGEKYVDHVGATNTKGQRELYTLAEFTASARQVQKLERLPWVRQERLGGPTHPSGRRSARATDQLQDAWPKLPWARRVQAALILARQWRHQQPIEKTMTFLRLCGEINDEVRAAVREGYRDEGAAPSDGDLLQALGVRV